MSIIAYKPVCFNRNSAGENFTFRVLLSGDYEFLCYMYGLSGASGTMTTYPVIIHLNAKYFQDVIGVCGA